LKAKKVGFEPATCNPTCNL